MDAFVTAPIIYLLQIKELNGKCCFKWAWTWKHDRIHIIILLMNILDGWIIRVPRQFQDVDVTNKDTLNTIDENILKCTWSKTLVFSQIDKWIIKYVFFMFIALTNLISTSWMHLHQIDSSLNKVFQNI